MLHHGLRHYAMVYETTVLPTQCYKPGKGFERTWTYFMSPSWAPIARAIFTPDPFAKGPFVVGNFNIFGANSASSESFSWSLLKPPVAKITALPLISSEIERMLYWGGIPEVVLMIKGCNGF